jgi:crotonobetainyl-CoA:carnitine CoA-transferase CaiB-like acyl-CoA transferase
MAKDLYMFLDVSLRILDLTRLLPGAMCTLFLAEMGADVIKIEDPQGGDYARWMPPLADGQGVFFQASNRRKRSVIINLKTAEGQAVLHRLAQSADVLIESYRPSVTARLNCDYDTLKAINPRLVYCSLSGWGQTGPYADESGHDLNYVALNGVMGSTRTPHPLGGQIADIGGAYAGAMAILGALLRRTSTGTGAYLDISLFEGGMPFGMYQWVESVSTGVAGGQGSLTGGMAFYEVYRSSDDQPLCVAAIEPKFWQNFCTAVNRPDWIPLHTNPAQQGYLMLEMQMLFATRTAAEWESLLRPADCCFTRVTPPAHLADDPHIQARGMAGIDEKGIPWMRSPIQINGERGPLGYAPGYGEHTHAVLSETGYTGDEVTQLEQVGAVRQG